MLFVVVVVCLFLLGRGFCEDVLLECGVVWFVLVVGGVCDDDDVVLVFCGIGGFRCCCFDDGVFFELVFFLLVCLNSFMLMFLFLV